MKKKKRNETNNNKKRRSKSNKGKSAGTKCKEKKIAEKEYEILEKVDGEKNPKKMEDKSRQLPMTNKETPFLSPFFPPSLHLSLYPLSPFLNAANRT